jgi:hypothetical protein
MNEVFEFMRLFMIELAKDPIFIYGIVILFFFFRMYLEGINLLVHRIVVDFYVADEMVNRMSMPYY